MAFDQVKYANEYNKEKYDKITILTPKGEKERWKAIAKRKGLSVSDMVRRAVDEYSEKK